MARMAVGLIAGVPAVKVTRNDAHDPATTPDNLYQRFLFNSRNEYGYISRVRAFAGSDYPGASGWYFVGGSGAGSAEYAIEKSGPTSVNLFALTGNWAGFPWHPMISARQTDGNGWFVGPSSATTSSLSRSDRNDHDRSIIC